MTKRFDTWMPLYIGDYLADTGRLTTEGHGAYLLLLMDYWRNGPPPDDDSALTAITKLEAKRWRLIRPQLEPFFTVRDGVWRQKRADAERERAGEIVSKRREAALSRWARRDGRGYASAYANAHANQHAKGMQTASPSPSHRESSSGGSAVTARARRRRSSDGAQAGTAAKDSQQAERLGPDVISRPDPHGSLQGRERRYSELLLACQGDPDATKKLIAAYMAGEDPPAALDAVD